MCGPFEPLHNRSFPARQGNETSWTKQRQSGLRSTVCPLSWMKYCAEVMQLEIEQQALKGKRQGIKGTFGSREAR